MKEKFIRLTDPEGDETILVQIDRVDIIRADRDNGGQSLIFLRGETVSSFRVKESPSQIIELMEGA